jgi:hypothetical protein
VSDPRRQAQDILKGLECGRRSSCPCHAAARRGHGLTHADWRIDQSPSLSVDVKDGRVLVHDHGGGDQEQTIAELRRRGLWPELTVRIARIPVGSNDVDELLRSPGGPERYERMVAEAVPAVGWMVSSPPSPGSRNWGLLGRSLARLHAVEREAYVRSLARQLEMPEPAVRAALADYLNVRRGDAGRSDATGRRREWAV